MIVRQQKEIQMEKQKTSNNYKFRDWLESSIDMAVDEVKNANVHTVDYQVASAELRLLRAVKYTYEKIIGESNDN